jgi:acyl carrier protein
MALISLGNLVDNVNGFFIKHGKGECHPIEVDTNLIDNDFLDSLSVVHFVIFLEEVLIREIPIGDFELNSIKTVGAIYDNYVLESLNRP